MCFRCRIIIGSNKSFKKEPRLITEAKGVYLKDHKGRKQIDASSGLFCNPLGHGRKEIIDAITKQLQTLDSTTQQVRDHPNIT